jgi:hypothetical protein
VLFSYAFRAKECRCPKKSDGNIYFSQETEIGYHPMANHSLHISSPKEIVTPFRPATEKPEQKRRKRLQYKFSRAIISKARNGPH